MKQNIGILNAMIRLIFGLTLLAVLTGKYTRRPHKESYIFLMMLAAMKVAEGILRFCPVTEIFNEGMKLKDMDLEDIAKPDSPMNPS